MPPADVEQLRSDHDGYPAIQCEDCESALTAAGRDTIAFLLLDELTIPLVGCEYHLERFREICSLTTEESAELLNFVPAGGVSCPACRLAGHSPAKPLVAVERGAVVVLACPEHQSSIIDLFRTGLETRKQLTSSLDGPM